jgi:hypothetical protein
LDGVIANPAVSPGVMVGFAEEAPGSMDDLLNAFSSGPDFAGCDLLAQQVVGKEGNSGGGGVLVRDERKRHRRQDSQGEKTLT